MTRFVHCHPGKSVLGMSQGDLTKAARAFWPSLHSLCLHFLSLLALVTQAAQGPNGRQRPESTPPLWLIVPLLLWL